MMEAKIMKYHFLHGLLAKFWQKIKIELSFFMDILLPEQVKKLVHTVHESAPFYLTQAWFIFCPPVFHPFQKREKFYTFCHLHTI